MQRPRRTWLALGLVSVLLVGHGTARAQAFYFGHDLSYANQMEDCGATFKEGGVEKDIYRIFADHGTNLVRLRLWVDPTWQQQLQQPPGVKPQYSDLADVREAIARAKAAGMQVLLDFHYSDFWADPGRQVIPARWRSVAHNLEALKDSVYAYTYAVLTTLDREGLMPEIVQVGNENNSGILIHADMDENYNGINPVDWRWSRHAQLFNAAIRAVRDAGAAGSVMPKIALHYAGLNGSVQHFQRLISLGVTDFDIMGLSYYYAFHGGSIAELGATIRELVDRFPDYQIMVLETAYPWTSRNYDALGNLLNTPDPDYYPFSPEMQRTYMVDLTRTVIQAGGRGVVFWEPDWVSTPCRTPWGQGSSFEHVAFFEPGTYNLIANGGIGWTHREWYADLLNTGEAITPETPVLLEAVYPVPFRNRLTVTYRLVRPQQVTVQVLDVLGRIVATLSTGRQPAGLHRLFWQPAALPTGRYLLRVQTSDRTESRWLFYIPE
ncbi:glycosyl hydrolase 53 family protein [Rhodothermus marinus]|uniref:glycosyl hydrolase 53 family protein n=1 Tax=Rhodothermus marinus TaxID=29549 RepID=UPI0012BA4D92|nr:glycosyl hydrolase 53 family protein [Rhodothermus marinus]BBM69795.1 arabinogalactan endo-beta-1,4-galactanase [Rhodothermus marinus]BBM72781.1 arabinogalactan endo-beta-1,4-galactanase [Rhodothermus marinus]